MRAFIALILLLAAFPAVGDAEAHQGADWVRITARPCTNEAVLARIEGDAKLDYRQASAEFQGVLYAPCWAPMGKSVHLVYEDGDEGILEQHELKPVLDV